METKTKKNSNREILFNFLHKLSNDALAYCLDLSCSNCPFRVECSENVDDFENGYTERLTCQEFIIKMLT